MLEWKVPPCPVYAVLGMNPRLCMLGKPSNNRTIFLTLRNTFLMLIDGQVFGVLLMVICKTDLKMRLS